jgi:hypothetical protein
MGDISEMRAVIVILAFVVFTVTLVGLMVSESPLMFSGMTSGNSAINNNGGATSPTTLLAWNSTYVLNITDSSDASYHFVIQGWNVAVFTVDSWGHKEIDMATYSTWWIFEWDWDDFVWYKDNVQVSNLNDIWFSMFVLDTHYSQNKTLDYVAQNSKTRMTVTFVFNQTAYTKPSDAYSAGGLSMVFQQDFNDRNTSINALSFIAGIFTFSLPGLPFIPNLILWIMIFPALMYLSFIFVLRVIGAVFGGGGA